MVSTPTTRLRIEKQSLGSNLNVWGDTKLNDALDRIDEAVGGVQAITISGTSTTLTSTNYATDQARKAALVLTGTLSANSTVTVPNVEKLYLIVNNATQGAYSLTVKTAAGGGYALRAGPQWVYCDATDVYRATGRLDQLPAPTAAVDLNSQKITGLATPTLTTDATTKAYVDAAASSVNATGAAASATNAAASAAAAATSATSAAGSATAAAGSATAAAASAASIAGGPVTSVNGSTGIVTITAASLSAAPLASPTFTGTPAAPTAAAATSTTQIATTAFVTTADALKADLASPTFTGTVTAPTITATGTITAAKYVTTAGATLTIAAGVVTATNSYHALDTEAAAATDDLDTINGGAAGMMLILRTANFARDVVCKDGTGNLKLAGDFTLSHTDDRLALLHDGISWLELSRSDAAV